MVIYMYNFWYYIQIKKCNYENITFFKLEFVENEQNIKNVIFTHF